MPFSTSDSDLKPFLLELGLEKYFDALMEEDVESVSTLSVLSDQQLQFVGLKMGAIARIRTAIASFSQASPAKISHSATSSASAIDWP
jgi:hypothetical protein